MYAPKAYIFLLFCLISKNFFVSSSILEEDKLMLSSDKITPFIELSFFIASKLCKISIYDISFLSERKSEPITLSSTTSETLNST